MKALSKVLLIDHDDSFTFNLQHWLASFADQVSIINHTELFDQNLSEFGLVVLSPGPKHPLDYPHIISFLTESKKTPPIFGVCLGMQLMTIASNGLVETYSPPLHGKTSCLQSDFSEINNLEVARYHSLKCSNLNSFKILASSEDLPMWIQHKTKKWMAVQFHPESFLTANSEAIQSFLLKWILA